MNTERLLTFLVGCIGTRSLITFLAYRYVRYLPYMGVLALIPAIGFAVIYVGGLRPTGVEVGGGKIWWNDLRPVHSALFGLFALNAIQKNANAWIFLLLDTMLGFGSFIHHYYGMLTAVHTTRAASGP